jgi:hypothetical protein
MLLEGVFSAVTTPYHPDGRLFLHKLERNIERYSHAPISGLVVLGSTGEAVMLDDAESREVLKTAAAAAAPEKVLLAGVGQASALATLRLAEFAAEHKYDAVLVRTPNYYSPQMSPLAMLTSSRTIRRYPLCSIPFLSSRTMIWRRNLSANLRSIRILSALKTQAEMCRGLLRLSRLRGLSRSAP